MTAKSVRSRVRPAKRSGLAIIPCELRVVVSMKAVLGFNWSSFKLNHAAVNVESHLASLRMMSEDFRRLKR